MSFEDSRLWNVLLILKDHFPNLFSASQMTNEGKDYTTATVSISGGGGTGATAIVKPEDIVDGKIKAITITNMGNNDFTSAPSILISGDGTDATAIAFVDAVDLTKKWVTIEYEDTYPQSAIITLSAARGRFCTTGSIIQKWDRVFLKITDQNGKTISTVVHVESLKKYRDEGGGLFLRLYCPHQSSNLLKQTISRPNRRTSGNKAMKQIISQINENKGSADPSVEILASFDEVNKEGNLLDDTTTNDYIFESLKVNDAVKEIVEREGNPVESGGSFQFMYFRLVSRYTGIFTEADLDVVRLQVFPQGFVFNTNDTEFNNIPNVTLIKPTLESGDRANILSLDSDLQTEKGTNLIALGDKNSGTYPIDYARFLGAKEVFTSATEWTEGQDYSISSLVTYAIPPSDDVKTYNCIQANTANLGVNDPSETLFWVEALFEFPDEWQIGILYTNISTVKHNEIGYTSIQTALSDSTNEPPNPDFWQRTSYIPTTNYSPLTKGESTPGAQYWINAMGGAKHAETDNVKTAVVDANVIIKDDFHPRTWVDTIQEDPADIPTTLLENGTDPFHTLRALAINPSTGANPTTGPWAPGNFDKNNVPFAGSILEFQNDPIEIDSIPQWVVINSTHPESPQAQNDQEIYDFDEGESWIKNPCTSGTVNGEGVCSISRSTVWQKGSYSITGSVANFQPDTQFDCVHPVGFDSGESRVKVENTKVIDEFNSETSGVSINFNPDGRLGFNLSLFGGANFAFPWPRTSNDKPYGPVTIGEQINLTQFDLLNMHLTKDGTKQWMGPRVEDYYPIQSFDFFEEIEHTYDLGGLSVYAPFGNYSMGLWVADRFDNQWMMDYPHSHNDNGYPQTASLGNRKVYRGVPGLSTFIAAKEPEVLDIVDPLSIVRGGTITKDSFDKQGRYNPLERFFFSSNITMKYDAFRMTKPLVTTNNDEPNALPSRNIEPLKLQFDKITSYAQLKNYVLTQQQILGFQTDSYTFRSSGRCDVLYGDPVYYTDPEAINETTDSISNTIKATASRITYSLSKTADGPVGFYRAIELITRLYPTAEV